jgi:hypothetical protein
VRVSEGRAAASDTWRRTDGKTRGYALYAFGEWDGAAAGYKNGNDPLSDAGAPEPLLFLPAGGYRGLGDGFVHYTGILGDYWSSVIDRDVDSCSMLLVSEGVSARTSRHNRADGLSVRCVEE